MSTADRLLVPGDGAPARPITLGSVLRRLGRLLLAYAAATLALMLVLPLVGLIFDIAFDPRFPEHGSVYFYLIGLISLIGIYFAFVYGAAPAAAWILISEIFKLRARAVHMAAVALACLAGWVWLNEGKWEDPFVWQQGIHLFFGGLVAGYVYWRIAGRTAGDFSRRRPKQERLAPPETALPQA